MAEAQNPYPFPSNLHVSSCVTLKLNESNYLLWKTRFEALLSSRSYLASSLVKLKHQLLPSLQSSMRFKSRILILILSPGNVLMVLLRFGCVEPSQKRFSVVFIVLKSLVMSGFSWLITLTGPNNNQSQRGRGGYSSRFGTRGRGGGYSTRGQGFSQQVNSTGWNQSQSNANNRPV